MIGQQIINGLMLGSVYAMVAVALTLSIGVLNFLNFSIPGLFMIGGMAFWALTQAGVPWPLAVLGAKCGRCNSSSRAPIGGSANLS